MRDVRAEMQGGDWRVGFLNFDIDTFVIGIQIAG